MTGADVILVGGGLANGLLALRLHALRPDLTLLVLEAGDTLGGDHTWSFHEGDVSADAGIWLDPLVVHRWPAYDVAFPGHVRRVALGYRSVTSERFHAVLSRRLGGSVRLGTAVAEVAPDHVALDDGRRIDAPLVIDGRGPAPSRHLMLAYQKFVGLELRFAAPHGLSVPLLMDATVPQHDGYRFVYVLPFGPDRALVEDTYYADGPGLDEATLRARVLDYAAARGWPVAAVVRAERGVLPIVLGGDPARFWQEAGAVPRSGLRAALFHPTTGYSLPDAARLADRVAGLPVLTSASVGPAIRDHATARWQAQGFFRLLNRMLFRAGDPADRFRVLQRFYGLPEPLIARFYAGDLALGDKVRLLAGRPPVPLLGAIRTLLDTSSRAATSKAA